MDIKESRKCPVCAKYNEYNREFVKEKDKIIGMEKFEKICEIIAVPPNKTNVVLETLEMLGVPVLVDVRHNDGDHYIVMRKESNKT